MPKINEEILQDKLLKIREMLVQCYPDKQIIEELDMPRSTYYKYKAALHTESFQNMKNQNSTDYGLYVDQLIDRLKLIFHYVSLRISDTSRISNRDLSTLASEAKSISYNILELEKLKYNTVFPDKQLPAPGQPALLESEELDSDKDMGMSYDQESGEYVHSKSTDANPIC
jgi:ACT domain-containing protein